MSKNKKIFIGILLVLIFVIPIIIYLISDSLEWLMFYGTMFSGAGAIVLGYIAIDQNNKFKKENDKTQEQLEKSNKEAQERLEKINERSNELNAINVILGYENQLYYDIHKALDRFSSRYDPKRIIHYFGNEKEYSMFDDVNKIIDDDFINIIMLLLRVNDDSSKNLYDAISDYYLTFKLIIKLDCINEEKINELSFSCCTYENAKLLFLKNYQEKIDKAIYDNLSLVEIKKLFNHNKSN